MTDNGNPYPMFLSRKALAEIVGTRLGLTPEAFQTLPNAPQAITWSPRRRRWRYAEVEAFVRHLEAAS